MAATLTAPIKTGPDVPLAPYRYITHPQTLREEVQRFIAASVHHRVYFDTETTGLDFFTLTPLLIQLYQEETPEVLVIDCRSIPHPYITAALRPILTGNQWLAVAHNMSYDWGVMAHHFDLKIDRLYCTWVAEKLLTAGLGHNCGLADVVRDTLGYYMDKSVREGFIDLPADQPITEQMLAYSAADCTVLPAIVRAQQKRLVAEGMVNIAKLEFAVLPALVEAHLWGVRIDEVNYRAYIAELEKEAERQGATLQEELQPYIEQYRAQRQGEKMGEYEVALAEWTMLKGFREEVAAAAKAQALIDGASGKEAQALFNATKKAHPCPPKPTLPEAGAGPINLGSTDQLGHALLLAGVPMKIEGDKPKTDALSLGDLEEEYPLVEQVMSWRRVIKLVQGFGEALLRFVDSNGRLHPRFNILGAATGRLSCEKPNVQQIPNSELGKPMRECFVAEPGYQLLAVDYSQIELRLLAEVSGEPSAIWAINAGIDLHSLTALRMFEEVQEGLGMAAATVDRLLEEARAGSESALEQVKDALKRVKAEYEAWRKIAKMINFGVAYGLSPQGLSARLRIPLDAAKKYIEAYFTRNPKIAAWLKRTQEDGLRNRYATTIMGRRRYLPENAFHPQRQRVDWNRLSRRQARQMSNFPIQASSADITKTAIALIRQELRERGLDARMLMTVHDELVYEVRADQLDTVQELVCRLMIEAGQRVMKSVVCEVSAESGDYWKH